MAAGTLRVYVCVEGPDGMVQFGPGNTVPDWAQPLITNSKAWAEQPEPQPEVELTPGRKAAATRKVNAEKKAANADAGDAD